MEIFIAICEDKHVDPYIRVFSSFEKAKVCCDDFVSDEMDFREMELTDAMIKANWIYYGTYEEGNGVRIEKRNLNED